LVLNGKVTPPATETPQRLICYYSRLFFLLLLLMAPTQIKICGITRQEDARIAVDCGANAIGLVFYRASARAVTAQQAAEIVRGLPPFVSVVALFVDEPADEIRRTLKSIPIDVLQFHGDESAAFCEQFDRPWIKAIRMKSDIALDDIAASYPRARALLLDSWEEGVPGGTGKTFDWQRADQALPLPLVLAGGLNAGNVGQAIAALQPAAVDVSGGVEAAPGIKDPEKIRQFVAAVRHADRLISGVSDEQ
jgi:phosphoribosylanthranilate isomerase